MSIVSLVRESPQAKLLRSAQTFLARWQRVPLRVEPGRQMPGLRLILFRQAPETKNLVLFLDPIWSFGNFGSDQSCLAVELVDADGSEAHGRTRYTHVFRISDPTTNSECLTEWFEIKENVAL